MDTADRVSIEGSAMSRVRNDGGDHGQSVALVIMVAALVMAALAGAVQLGAVVVERQQARAAADAAALAALQGGEDAARAMAIANGAQLVSCRMVDVDTVEVVVASGEVTAVARASRAP